MKNLLWALAWATGLYGLWRGVLALADRLIKIDWPGAIYGDGDFG